MFRTRGFWCRYAFWGLYDNQSCLGMQIPSRLQKRNFGGMNRHFKPNLQKKSNTHIFKSMYQLDTKSDTLMWPTTEALMVLIWWYKNSKMTEAAILNFKKLSVSQPLIEILAWNFVRWLRYAVKSRQYVQSSHWKSIHDGSVCHFDWIWSSWHIWASINTFASTVMESKT